MTLEDLKQLIASDPEATKLAETGQDADCAARCSLIATPIRKPIPNRDVKRHAIMNDYWAAVVIVAEDTAMPNELRGLAIAVGAWVNDSEASTDVDLPKVQQMLGGLVAYKLMTAEQRDSLMLLADQPQTITAAEVSAVFSAERQIARGVV